MLRLQGFKVHSLSERLPQFAARCRSRTWTWTITGSDKPTISCFLRRLKLGVLVVQRFERRLRRTLRVNVEDSQRSVLSADGGRASSVVPLELVDDGGELGIERRTARLGPRGRT